MSIYNATSMAPKTVVAKHHNKSTCLQFATPKLVSPAAAGGVASASGTSHAPNVMLACKNPNSLLYQQPLER